MKAQRYTTDIQIQLIQFTCALRSKLGTFVFSSCIALIIQMMLISIAQSKEIVDRVAIIVDDQSILESDLHSRLKDLKLQIAESGSNAPPENILLPQLVERMILESIQDQMAKRYQIQISDSDINNALSRIAQRQKMSLHQYLKKLERQGQSTSTIRGQVESELKHYQLQQRVLSNRIQVNPKEVDNFLQSKEAATNQNIEYKLRHILLQVSERAEPKEVEKRKEQALAIIESIENETNTFAQTALAISNDSFALKGGDMGWRRISQVPARFTQILLQLNPGDISKPIRSPSGFHILYLEDKKGERAVMVDRAKIEHILIKPNQIRSEEQAAQLADDLRQDIQEGKTLAELARTFSDDPGSALNGGDLGWVSLESLDKTFAKTAQEMQLNAISPVFRSTFGFHILRVTDRKQEDMGQAMRQNKAQRWLQQRKFEEYLPVWLSEIRAEAYVEFKPPYEALARDSL